MKSISRRTSDNTRFHLFEAYPRNTRLNFIDQLILLSNSSFTPSVFEELYLELDQYPATRKELKSETDNSSLKKQISKLKLDYEIAIFQKAFEDARFSESGASAILGISRTTLWRKLKEAGLS